VTLGAVLAVLALGEEGRSQDKNDKGKGSSGQKGQKTPPKPPPPADPLAGIKALEMQNLRAAYTFLGLAKPIYTGHRKKAMDHVTVAARLVQKGAAFQAPHGPNGSDALSDMLMLQARAVEIVAHLLIFS
jgi:hypothetical protein